MKKALVLIFTSFILSSCNASNISDNQFNDILQSSSKTKTDDITAKIVLDNPAFTSSGVELSVFAIQSDNKIIRYQTRKSGSSVMAITTVYKSKWVEQEVRNTTGADADTALKLLKQGGYSKEYTALYERYSILGLI